MVDRSSGYATGSGNWADTRVGLINPDSDPVNVTSNLFSVGELNTGDALSLGAFVNWAATQYSAQNSGLVIWDHGDGLDGVAWDYNTPNYDHFSIRELGAAIDNSGVHFDFIGFDACLMAMTEVVYDLADNADYIVASQDLEPGNGWAYDDWLKNPITSLSASEIVSGIVTTFAAEYGTMKGIALSAMDTRAMTGLATALNDFAAEVTDGADVLATSGDLNLLTSAAQTAYEFGGGKDEYIDLR
jgi:hypothetical protein